MASLGFKLSNTPIKEDIENYRDIEIELSFESVEPKSQVSTGSLEFVGKAYELLSKWHKSGLSGSKGIFEAPPLQITACGTTIFDGGVDLANCETLFECDKITAPLREAYKMDFLNERASSFSFAYLADPSYSGAGKINQSDYVKVPYVLNTIPNYAQALMGGLSLYILIKELKEIVRETASAISKLIGVVTTAVGSLINPVIAAAMAVGQIVQAIVQIGLYIAYLAFIITAIIDLMKMLYLSLIQPLKYKKGIKVSTLLQRGCQYLGLNFSSTIFNTFPFNNAVIIPKKTALINNQNQNVLSNVFGLGFNLSLKQYDDNINPNSYGYFEGTFADLILSLNDTFNAKPVILVANGIPTLHYERKDFLIKQAQYTLPALDFTPNNTNACELASNYYIAFALDDSETNTYDLYEGTTCQHIQEVASVINKGNILLSNIDEKRLLFARAKRKTTYTIIEEIFIAIYNLVKTIYDTIVAFINGIIQTINSIVGAVANLFGFNPPTIPTLQPMPQSPITLRIGAMLLSTDFIGVSKLLLVDSASKVDINNEQYTSAKHLMDRFHFINFAYTTKDSSGNNRLEHNQYLIYKSKEIPLCCADFLKIKNNNFVKTPDNRIAKVDSLVWNPSTETAKINFRVKELYTKNLKETYIIDGN